MRRAGSGHAPHLRHPAATTHSRRAGGVWCGARGGIHRLPPRSATTTCVWCTRPHTWTLRQPATLARLLFLDPEHPWDELLLDAVSVRGRRHARRCARPRRRTAASGSISAAATTMPRRQGRRLLSPSPTSRWPSAACSATARRARADRRPRLPSRQRQRRDLRRRRVGLHVLDPRQQLVLADQAQQPRHRTAGPHGRRASISTPCAAACRRFSRQFRPEFVFYVAGSDPFVEDRLGDFDISEAGMLERDQFVTRGGARSAAAARGRDRGRLRPVELADSLQLLSLAARRRGAA